MSPTGRTFLLGLALAVASGTAQAAMRCGHHQIVEGDTADELQARCGPPAGVDRRTVTRPPVIWRYGRPIYVPGGQIEVAYEIWTYNFGSNQFMRRVHVEDGIVKSIETIGYGYD